jgi:hypothetical protein
MKKLRYALLILAAGSLILFAVNLLGKGVFLNVTLFGRTVVAAASQGVCHLALTSEEMQGDPMDDVADDFLSFPDIGYHELIDFGPISVAVENRLDPMNPFGFSLTRGDVSFDYSAVEFPWLLIPLVLFPVFFITRQKQNAEQGGDGDEAV